MSDILARRTFRGLFDDGDWTAGGEGVLKTSYQTHVPTHGARRRDAFSDRIGYTT